MSTTTESAAPPRPISWSPDDTALPATLIVVAALAVFANSLSAPFIFDDHQAIAENPTIRHLWPLGPVLHPPADGSAVEGRPIVNLTFALNHALGGLDVWGYHFVNLIIHALAGLTLFGIVRRTAKRWSGLSPTRFALAVALIWTVHPLVTEAVTSIVQRTESLMGLFYLLTLYCFIRFSGDRPLFGWLSAACCLVGMATKEVMITAPLAVLLYDRCFVAGSFAEAWRLRRAYYLGLAATWLPLAAIVISENLARGSAAGFGLGVSAGDYLLTQFWALTRYLRLAVWPSPLILDYGTEVIHDADAVAPQAVVLLALLAATVAGLRRRPALGYLGAWFFLILLPSSSLFPLVSQTIAEHRMYLPLASVVVLAVLGLHALIGPRALYLCLALAAGLGWATRARNHDYRSEVAIWSDTVAKRPNNARAHDNLGLALAQAGRTKEAIKQYEEALRLRPNYPDVYNNVGNGLYNRGDLAGAVDAYRKAIQIAPDYADAWSNLGNGLHDQQKWDESIDAYEKALALKPGLADAHTNLGNLLRQRKRLPEALRHLQAAVYLNPDQPAMHYNLALALQASRRFAEAIQEYWETLQLDPGFTLAQQRLDALQGVNPITRPAETKSRP